MKRRIESTIKFKVMAEVSGMKYEGESYENAVARLANEAERHGNDGKARIHISLVAEKEEAK